MFLRWSLDRKSTVTAHIDSCSLGRGSQSDTLKVHPSRNISAVMFTCSLPSKQTQWVYTTRHRSCSVLYFLSWDKYCHDSAVTTHNFYYKKQSDSKLAAQNSRRQHHFASRIARIPITQPPVSLHAPRGRDFQTEVCVAHSASVPPTHGCSNTMWLNSLTFCQGSQKQLLPSSVTWMGSRIPQILTQPAVMLMYCALLLFITTS